MFFVTISRQTGSLGDEIASLLSQRLEMKLITHDFVMSNWLPQLANKYELHMLKESPKFYRNQSASGIRFSEFIEHRLREEVEKNPVVILGLGAQVIFYQNPYAINVRIVASKDIRRSRLIQKYGLSADEAERFLTLSDRKHRRYISTIYEKDWSDPTLYHICINTDNMSIDEAVEALAYLVETRSREHPSGYTKETKTLLKENTEPVSFAHPSEEEFSKILDMYNIEWDYEPKTFPIEWDAEGNVTKAFTPDFYLPKFDTYIELTTMEQKYVSEKKKKVRLLKKLYPGTNINIVFKKDFHTLLKRYGLTRGDDSK